MHAAEAAWRPRDSRTKLARLSFFLLLAAASSAASADVGATASIFRDDQFRGYSLSQGQPVAILAFDYDDPSGLYAGASGTGVLRSGGDPAPLGFQVDGGYATHLGSGTSLDFGITHSSYSHYSSGSSYTEAYVGLARGGLSSRISVSPHYFETGGWAAYGEVNGVINAAAKWTLDGHVGVLLPLGSDSMPGTYRTNFDWRIGVTRELGRVGLHAAWTDGAPGRDYYHDRKHSRSALVLGASVAL